MPRNNRQTLKFYQKLILNRYLLSVFGANKFEDIADTLKSPMFEELLSDGNTRYYVEFMNSFHNNIQLTDEQLQQYDLNIVSHLNKINNKRNEKIKLKYFQYLSLLFIEYYLDMFFNHKDQLINDLNNFKADFALQYDEINSIPNYVEEDLNKIALWNATGSGKTLIMHINYYQYLFYAGNIADDDTFILLTPKEGLSKQHLDEFILSNIPAEVYDKNASRGFAIDRNSVQVLENTKLAKKDGEKTVAASRFGSSNVVFVDEGHRGASGDTWYKFRNELCKNGFSFEYSATFGQAVAASNDRSLESEYAKCIIFDYSYKYFYADGYGKDYNIINLQDNSNLDVSEIYLSACLLTYYQQKKLYIDKKDEYKKFNIENPLMVFVGSSVNAVRTERGRSTSDVVDILFFFNDFIKNKEKSLNSIKRIIEHDTGILDALNRDVFRNSFPYLTSLGLTESQIFDDILHIVFNCQTNSSILHIENMKGIDGEISLRLGENEPFGLINVGDDSKLISLCESNGFNTGSIDFKESLFESINRDESKINLLIGSKKFTEGWNCWRVSTMGLMNVGRSEGSEIIQLFGRGVRLKGYSFSLLRSKEYANLHRSENVRIPEYISYLETLNIFGVRADYMNKFKEYLEREGVPTSKDAPFVIAMPIIRNKKYKNKKLYSLQVKEGLEYKKDASKLVLEYVAGVSVDIDCYGKVQFESSKDNLGSELEKTEGKLNAKHFALLNMNELLFTLEKYKSEKLRHNVIINEKGIKTLLDNNTWYKLLIPSDELEIKSFSDYEKFKRILVALVKKYMDKLYNVSRSSWENNYMEYKLVTEDYENFIDDNKYIVAINDVEENQELIEFIKNLKDEVAEAKRNRQLIDYSIPKKKGNFEMFSYEGSLYNPLMYVKKGEKEIVISPVALVESEKKFVLSLDLYVKTNIEEFSNKEIYLIRNKANKGVGFFETAGFYPDFIMWLIDGEKQYITFIEPHGMVYEKLLGEKVQLHNRIKEIQQKLENENVVLNSIIITTSAYQSLLDVNPKEEWYKNHVVFTEDGDYIKRVFELIK